MVSKQSQPLAQVATPDLNALKAYSLGERAYNDADLKDAEAYFNEALRIDPHFALAYIALAKIHEAENQPDKALQSIRHAQADYTRLSARDALYVQAWSDSYTAPKKALEKWKLLVSVYPDYFPALGAYAYFLREYANQFENAIPYLRQSITSKNPHRAASETMLGVLYLEEGSYKDAKRSFSEAASNGAHSQSTVYTLSYAAQRDFSHADAVMGIAKSASLASEGITDAAAAIAVAADQGHWRQAKVLLEAAQAKAASMSPRVLVGYRMISSSLAPLEGTPTKTQIASLTDLLAMEKKAVASTDPVDQQELKFDIVLTAYLAAHAGDVDLARRALAAGPASDADTPVLDNLRGVAQAEIQRASGKPQAALATLKPLVDGSELYITHVALLDAYSDVHNNANALAEARWLSTHRGRAYAESNMRLVLAPFNVASSDMGLLRSAELSGISGDEVGAHQFLTEFKHAWPSAKQMPWLTSRLLKVSK
jgi:tetratricopeptide (TPR) repeat protein